MGKQLHTKSKFAKLAGVNPSTVTRLAKTRLVAAMVGERVDAAHPDAVAYVTEKTTAPTPPPATGIDPLYEKAVEVCQTSGRWSGRYLQAELTIGRGRAKKILDTMVANGVDALPVVNTPALTSPEPEPPSDPGDFSTFDIPDDIRAFNDMTMGELIRLFGTDTRFLDWLKATKSIEDINEKRLKNATTEGALVSRDLVRTGIIEPFDAAHIKLLTDGAKTITVRAVAMHQAERTLDEIEKFVKDQMTSFIRPVKAKVSRALRNA